MDLYHLGKELQMVKNEIIDDQGVISEELEARLDSLNLELNQKAQGIRKWLTGITGNEESINKEIKRLQHILMGQSRLRQRLEQYVKTTMENADVPVIETPIGTFSIVKNPPSVEVVVKEMVPDQFMRVIPEQKEPNKTLIADALKSGVDVPGCKLITDRTRLKIK